MQRYKMSPLAQEHTHYIGGVGRYDIFYDNEFGPRVYVKWEHGWGLLCPVTRIGLRPDNFEEINTRLKARMGPPMTEDEYATMVAICELFGPIVAASVKKDNPVSLTTNTNLNQKD
jgi:hypothetical protein